MKPVANPINIIDPKDNLSLPIYIMHEGFVPPDEGNYYLITGDGFWLRKDTGIVHGFVRLNGIGQVPKFQPKVGMRLPLAPKAIIFQALMFFRYIYRQSSSECLLAYVYSEEQKAFGFTCPEQKTTGSTIKYNPSDIKLPDGLALIGTFHSHCGFGAFHSGSDRHDEADFDGLHVTIGNVDKEEFTISASVVVNNHRQEIDPMLHLSGIKNTGHIVSKYYTLDMTKEETNALYREYSKQIKKWETKVTPSHYEPPSRRNWFQQEITHPAIPQITHDPDSNLQAMFHIGEKDETFQQEKKEVKEQKEEVKS